MYGQTNPDERFAQVESTLRLASSQRHLLMAQVLRNDRMDRAETAIQKTAKTMLVVAEKHEALTDKLDALTDKVDALTDIIASGTSGTETVAAASTRRNRIFKLASGQKFTCPGRRFVGH
jgi:hypothetical protein